MEKMEKMEKMVHVEKEVIKEILVNPVLEEKQEVLVELDGVIVRLII
jgi:hypothetical protein